MARLITLYEWAIEEFGNSAPGKATLSNYAKRGMIYPPALKVGRSWMVEKDARYVGITKPLIRPSDSPLLKRILSDTLGDLNE
ncbi:excisionase [Ewingella sp. AOP8-B2-18]